MLLYVSTFQRFDKASFSKAVRTDAGYLKAPARLTRVGVFEYTTADGSKVRELRLPEEVFKADALESFKLMPLTDDHPYAYGGIVNADNIKQLQVGSVSEPVQNGQFVEADIVVTDSAVIQKILDGKARELSCGYYCDREAAPAGAVWKDDSGREFPYDFIQRNIRGNHVAVVARGRAGPEVRVQLDSAAAIQTDAEPEIETEAVTPKEDNTMEIEALKLELDKAQARADSAEALLESVKAELVKANDPARLAEAVRNRVALETKARTAVPSINTDGLSDVEVKRAVVTKLNESVKLDGKSDDYVSAAFELLCDGNLTVRNPAAEAVAAAVKEDPKPELKADSAVDSWSEFTSQFFSAK